jgi:hypothetical protein
MQCCDAGESQQSCLMPMLPGMAGIRQQLQERRPALFAAFQSSSNCFLYVPARILLRMIMPCSGSEKMTIATLPP